MKKKNTILYISLLIALLSCLFLVHFQSFSTPDNNKIDEKDKTTDKNSSKINLTLNSEGFELPLNGSTGYTSIKMNLLNNQNEIIKELPAGTPFTIIKEEEKYFLVQLKDKQTGYLEHKYCFINLPDVIPSIIYDNTNSYRSIFKSNGEDLPAITNEQLYNAFGYNERFKKQEFLMPVLYTMAKKISKVQNEALKNGESLVIYETFRPYDVQMQVSNSLETLMNSNPLVYNLINTYPWSKGWFIATKLSNHQRGLAIDTSLAKITKSSINYTGHYEYLHIDEYIEYNMPTPMHELSSLASTFKGPVDSSSKTAFKTAEYASSMNDEAIKLQTYCLNNGLSPLASEWWHFNDLDAKEETNDKKSDGKYYILEGLSKIPE